MALKLIVDTLEGLDSAIHALYAKGDDGKFRLGVDGVPDVTKLESALQKEREANGAAQKALKQFEGLDAAEIRKMLAAMEGDEEAMLIKAGKIDEVVGKRTDKLAKDAQKRITAAEAERDAQSIKAQKWLTKALDSEITRAATKAGLHSYAVDDAMLYARQMFSLDDEGNAVQLGADGKPVLGKDGKTPFTPLEWLETMKETKPHWFPATANGGGARQSNGAAGGKTMKRSDFDGKPAKEKAVLMKSGITLYD